MNLKRIVRSAIKGISVVGSILSAFSVGVLGALIALALLGTHMIIAMAVLDLLGWWGFWVHVTGATAVIIWFVMIRDVREVGWWVSMATLPAIWSIGLVFCAVVLLGDLIDDRWRKLCTWCEYES
jgi:hypothetical protein